MRAVGQGVQQCRSVAENVFADNTGRAQIDQVPVVHPSDVPQVKFQNFSAFRRIAPPVLLHQNQQSDQTDFVPRALQQLFRLRRSHAPERLRHFPALRIAHAKKAVARTVLAGSGLEKTLKPFRIRIPAGSGHRGHRRRGADRGRLRHPEEAIRPAAEKAAARQHPVRWHIVRPGLRRHAIDSGLRQRPAAKRLQRFAHIPRTPKRRMDAVADFHLARRIRHVHETGAADGDIFPLQDYLPVGDPRKRIRSLPAQMIQILHRLAGMAVKFLSAGIQPQRRFQRFHAGQQPLQFRRQQRNDPQPRSL
ncbi:hypothetical protein SDC9_103754 [bioreactor metagenome]|uniref:Uncharacterized protein n=1 Tax=bioreactor metagenome TaxID=1076179 RepID=A0A645AV01_9ZZZZ